MQATLSLGKASMRWGDIYRMILLVEKSSRTDLLLFSTPHQLEQNYFLYFHFLVQGVEWLTGQIKDGMDGKR